MHPQVIGVPVAALVGGIGHHNVRPLTANEPHQGSHRFVERRRRKGSGLIAGRHVGVPVAQHPHTSIAEVRRRRDQLLPAHLGDAFLHLRPIQLRVENAARLSTGAAHQHHADACRRIARCARPAFGGLVVGGGREWSACAARRRPGRHPAAAPRAPGPGRRVRSTGRSASAFQALPYFLSHHQVRVRDAGVAVTYTHAVRHGTTWSRNCCR